jgi:hypothetical protein
MRFAASISLLFVALAPLGFAQQSGEESGLTAIITQLPSCAVCQVTMALQILSDLPSAAMSHSGHRGIFMQIHRHNMYLHKRGTECPSGGLRAPVLYA